MKIQRLENVKEGSYIWLQREKKHVGYIAIVIDKKIGIFNDIRIYSKEYGYESLKMLEELGYNIVLLDNLKPIDPKDLRKTCNIVIEYVKEKWLYRYEADIFNELGKNNILYLNGCQLFYNPLKHKIYQIPVEY